MYCEGGGAGEVAGSLRARSRWSSETRASDSAGVVLGSDVVYKGDRSVAWARMNQPLRSRLFQLFAVAFAAAGLFHATAFFHPEIAEAVPRYWHAVFAFVQHRPRRYGCP